MLLCYELTLPFGVLAKKITKMEIGAMRLCYKFKNYQVLNDNEEAKKLLTLRFSNHGPFLA